MIQENLFNPIAIDQAHKVTVPVGPALNFFQYWLQVWLTLSVSVYNVGNDLKAKRKIHVKPCLKVIQENLANLSTIDQGHYAEFNNQQNMYVVNFETLSSTLSRIQDNSSLHIWSQIWRKPGQDFWPLTRICGWACQR